MLRNNVNFPKPDNFASSASRAFMKRASFFIAEN